jgi:hypothetical protein
MTHWVIKASFTSIFTIHNHPFNINLTSFITIFIFFVIFIVMIMILLIVFFYSGFKSF